MPTDKKGESAKVKEDAGKAKAKDKETAKPKMTLDKLPTPTDAIVVIMSELNDAMAMFPRWIIQSAEAYAKREERIKALERQLANDNFSRHPAS